MSDFKITRRALFYRAFLTGAAYFLVPRAGRAQDGSSERGPKGIYLSPTGDDIEGTGSLEAPFRQPWRAARAARPGDTVYFRPGTYAPFEITTSGTAGAPITYTTLPGEEHQAIIRGDLEHHRVNGGPGIPKREETRDGIRIDARDHIHIRHLTIEGTWRAGIFVVGRKGAVHGHHVFDGNVIRNTGSAAILVCGFNPHKRQSPAETERLRTTNILIQNNDISATNVVTDFNSNRKNSRHPPGGVNEAISVAAAVGDVVTRFNDIHDSRQYGIDYKAGVRGGAIYGNRIWNMERYGIYLDAGRRFVDDIDVYNNLIWNCRAGIVLAREADFDKKVPVEDLTQRLSNLNIFNNAIWDIGIVGIYCQGHPGDAPYGSIRDVRIRFNTVYNAARSGKGREARLSEWADRSWRQADVVKGFEFIGNILWREGGNPKFLNEFEGVPGFTVRDNLVDADPLFVDPTAAPPDLSLRPGSPAIRELDTGLVATPFETALSGQPRARFHRLGAF